MRGRLGLLFIALSLAACAGQPVSGSPAGLVAPSPSSRSSGSVTSALHHAQWYPEWSPIQTGRLISYSIRGCRPDRRYGAFRRRADPGHLEPSHKSASGPLLRTRERTPSNLIRNDDGPACAARRESGSDPGSGRLSTADDSGSRTLNRADEGDPSSSMARTPRWDGVSFGS
jgi:hypothetical protein